MEIEDPFEFCIALIEAREERKMLSDFLDKSGFEMSTLDDEQAA